MDNGTLRCPFLVSAIIVLNLIRGGEFENNPCFWVYLALNPYFSRPFTNW